MPPSLEGDVVRGNQALISILGHLCSTGDGGRRELIHFLNTTYGAKNAWKSWQRFGGDPKGELFREAWGSRSQRTAFRILFLSLGLKGGSDDTIDDCASFCALSCQPACGQWLSLFNLVKKKNRPHIRSIRCQQRFRRLQSKQTAFQHAPEETTLKYSLARPRITLEAGRVGSPLISCRWPGVGLAVGSIKREQRLPGT